MVERSPIADILDGCLAGILYEGTDDTVCNIYESDAYTKRVELAKRWQEKGYLAKDVITNIESGQSQVIAGDAFAAEFVIKPDEMQYEESLYGDKVIIIPFDNRPVLDTEDDWVTVWSIFSETKYPEEAVKVLGLLYSDEDVLTRSCTVWRGCTTKCRKMEVLHFRPASTAATSDISVPRNGSSIRQKPVSGAACPMIWREILKHLSLPQIFHRRMDSGWMRARSRWISKS